jgi:hypothetical protein
MAGVVGGTLCWPAADPPWPPGPVAAGSSVVRAGPVSGGDGTSGPVRSPRIAVTAGVGSASVLDAALAGGATATVVPAVATSAVGTSVVPAVATSAVGTSVVPAVATSAVATSPASLAAAFRGYLARRPGHVSVAIYDAVAGTTVAVTDPAVAGYETASSVKLDILTALVRRAGASGRLTAREQVLARKMISVSDNGAASALWADIGGARAMNAFFAQLSMRATTAGPGGKWGLTRTTAADQLAVLRAIAYPGVLSAAGRGVVSGLLKTVIPAQRWGLTGGVPAGVTVDLKNGWLPRTSGWVITSLAHVHGAGRDYVMAAYTKNGPSMASGVTTVQGLSALAWRAARVSPAVG